MISRKRVLITFLLLWAAGCEGGPTIDATSDAALVASLKQINRSLGESGRRRFGEDCWSAIFRDAQMFAPRGDVTRVRGRLLPNANLYRVLDGLTVSQVHDEAERVRRQVGRVQAKAQGSPEADSPEPAGSPGIAQPGATSAPEVPAATLVADASVPSVAAKVTTPPSHLVPDPTWSPKAGEKGILFDPRGRAIYAGNDLMAWGDLCGSSKVNDELGMANLVKLGRAFLAENGTAILVVSCQAGVVPAHGVRGANVRMLDGDKQGQLAWVASTTLASLVEPQVALARVEAKVQEERRLAEAKATAGMPGAQGVSGRQAPFADEAARKAKAAWDEKLAKVYPVAKKALNDAKKRKNQRAVDKAAAYLMQTYGLARTELDRLMDEGWLLEQSQE